MYYSLMLSRSFDLSPSGINYAKDIIELGGAEFKSGSAIKREKSLQT